MSVLSAPASLIATGGSNVTSPKPLYDASVAEAVETLISSNVSAELLAALIKEGRTLRSGRRPRVSVFTLEERFWKRVQKSDGCWEWKGAKNGWYGSICVGGSTVGAHRVSWWIHSGFDSIPEGMVIDHLCHNRACVNPAHLRVATFSENTINSESPPAVNSRRTHCTNGHPLSGDNLFIENGKRRCRVCNRKRSKNWKSKNANHCAEYSRKNASEYYANNREEVLRKLKEKRRKL
jgi:hypothetical protein